MEDEMARCSIGDTIRHHPDLTAILIECNMDEMLPAGTNDNPTRW